MLKIIRFFIDKPKIVNLILLFILLAGILSILNVKKEGYPSADFGFVSILTTYPGASPRDVELKVTNKIEEKLKGINGIKEMKSWSIENLSNISIQMEDWVDVDKVKNNIQSAVDQIVDLPDDVKKPIVTLISMSAFPIMEIAVTGSCDYKTKRDYAVSLERKLERNKFVSKVDKVGYYDREIKIEVDQEKLIKRYVSFGELMSVISDQNFSMSTGDLLSVNQKKFIVNSEFKEHKDVGNVIIRSGYEGEKIIVSDVAAIIDDFEDPETIIKYNSNETINLIVYEIPNGDMIDATNSIKKIVNSFKQKLPNNVQILTIVDYSVEAKNLLSLVINNAWFGFILVIIVLILLLNFRLAFWTAMGIPTSILIAFILFPILGLNINFITLMAIIIVLGMLVDDAIIIGENIYRYRENGLSKFKAAYIGTKEVMWPVITTILTTIIVFLPMMGMSGMMGKFMRQMPLVVILMLSASLIEALFILPTHIAHLKMKKNRSKTAEIFRKIENIYEKFIKLTLRNKEKTIFIFIIIFILAIGLLASPIMKFILFPSFDGLYAYVTFEAEKGTSLERVAEMTKNIEEIILTMPKEEVHGFTTVIGEKTPNVALFTEGQVMSEFLGNITIYLTPISDRKRNLFEIVKELKEKISQVKGFKKIEVDKVEDGPPVGRPVTVTFISNNDELRNKMANKLKTFLKEQKGASNINDNQGKGKKRIIITFDYNKMSKLGLNPLNVASILRAAFEGTVVTSQRYNGEDVDFRVILNKHSRGSLNTLTAKSIQNLRSLTVRNNQGKLIPLGQFVKLEESDDVMMINHFAGLRSLTVYADLDTDIITSKKMNAKIRNYFKPILKNYTNLEIVFGGEEQDMNESMKSLGIAFILAIIGVYFILVILFNSFSQPFLVMLTIPFGFAGVVFAFFIHAIPFSFVAMIGMIGLTGVVVNDSLVMITFLNNAQKNESVTIDRLAKAARNRLRPIVLTTLTTAAGLFPSAYGFGGNNPFIIPMILAIAWGIVFATLITLILIPSMYLALHNISQRIKGFKSTPLAINPVKINLNKRNLAN